MRASQLIQRGDYSVHVCTCAEQRVRRMRRATLSVHKKGVINV
jgi:hypothetical protein